MVTDSNPIGALPPTSDTEMDHFASPEVPCYARTPQYYKKPKRPAFPNA